MVKSLLIAVNEKLSCDDLGKLLLRLAVGGLMLFHGLHKLFGVGLSAACWWKGLPGFIAYGVLIGEVVAPILIILGLFTRPAALVLAFTMVVAWLMVGRVKPSRSIRSGHGRLKAWSTSLSARWRWRF
jgi:putative oxidoreductase